MKQNNFVHNKYGLKESIIDAFADKVARIEHLDWWTNRSEELKNWNSLIKKALNSNTNFIQFIIGNYGRGKTLSLLKVSEDYKKNDLIYSVILNLKGEERSTPGLDLILRIFRSIDFERLIKKTNTAELQEIIKKLPENFKELKQILWKIYFGNLGSEQLTFFNSSQPIPQNIYKELAQNFLNGLISPTSAQLKELGILKKLDKIDVAKEYLNGLLFFIRKLGYKTFLICIDEFEGLFSLVSKNQQSTYIALLRSIYDFPTEPIKKEETTNMIIFIGISEAGWESLQEMEKKESVIGGPTVPLLERIEKPIVLSTFNENQTEKLIEKRLTFNRLEGKFENEPLIPFTSDFVKYIHSITNGEPRYILIRTSHVLDAGIAEKVVKLDKIFAERVLAERGLA